MSFSQVRTNWTKKTADSLDKFSSMIPGVLTIEYIAVKRKVM